MAAISAGDRSRRAARVLDRSGALPQRVRVGTTPEPDGLSGLPPAFAEALDAFCTHLELERNASAHTLRAYRGDLTSLFDHAARLRLTGPGELDLATLRSWLAR